MHIASTTHEHAITAKGYTYEGNDKVSDPQVRWKADISHGYALDYRITYYLRCNGGDGGRGTRDGFG